MSSSGKNWIHRPKKYTLTRSQTHRATQLRVTLSPSFSLIQKPRCCASKGHFWIPKSLNWMREGSPSILHLMSNEAATGTVCREQGCMQRKLWESLQSPTDCNTEFWMAEVLPAFRPVKCRDAHVFVLATHWCSKWVQLQMRYSTASKMHTLARTTPLIHSLMYFQIVLWTCICKINSAAFYSSELSSLTVTASAYIKD